MTERTDASDIFQMAFAGSSIAAGLTTIVASLLFALLEQSAGIPGTLIFSVLWGLVIGLFLVVVLATPVGFAVGLLVGLTGPIDRLKAMFAGLVSGLVSVLVLAAFFIPDWRDIGATAALILAAYPVLRVLSGLLAHRLVLGRSSGAGSE